MTVQALNGLARAHGRWVNQPVSQGRRLLVVNLMPTKEATELQFLNLLARTKVDCQVGFAYRSVIIFAMAMRRRSSGRIGHCQLRLPSPLMG